MPEADRDAHLRGAAAHPQRQPVRVAQPDPRTTPACSRSSPDEKTQAFMTQSVLSLSDSFFYPAPMLSRSWPTSSRCRPACSRSTRAPGKTLVYLGAVLAHRRRLRDALHSRTAPVGLARARAARAARRRPASSRCPPPAARSTRTPSSSSSSTRPERSHEHHHAQTMTAGPPVRPDRLLRAAARRSTGSSPRGARRRRLRLHPLRRGRWTATRS